MVYHQIGCLSPWHAHHLQVAYKKLLNGSPTLNDLEDAQPTLAKGLKSMLEYDGDAFQDIFCRTFEVEYCVFDSVCHILFHRLSIQLEGCSRPMVKL
jgi:hypothetical protein